MRERNRIGNSAFSVLFAIALAGLMAGCAPTAAPEPNVMQRAECEKPALPPPSGFLGADYALLKPPAGANTEQQQAQLAYFNPNVSFASYTKIMIAPVTYWGGDDSKLSASDQQVLCNYFYGKLKEVFSQNFTLTDEPGPGVAKLSVALTDASSAVPVLRTVALVVPQARALSTIKQGLTGTYSFVGSATGEAKLTDSATGQLLAAWADQRVGSAALKNVDVWQWGDAENAMNYWATGLDKRVNVLGVQLTASQHQAGM